MTDSPDPLCRPRCDESRTKIIATVGPACDADDRLEALIRRGVSVFRINTAHGDIADHQRRLSAIRRVGDRVGYQPAVLMDLAGPKIRLGELVDEPHTCDVGQRYTFVRERDAKDPFVLTSNYDRLIDELDVGGRVMLADGLVELRVESVDDDRAVCVVRAGGVIRSRQGINLPGAKLSVSSLLDDDIANAEWAAENEIDWISLSFVRSADDIRRLRDIIVKHQSSALIISKIEKPEALENLEAIVDASDGVMVARGDLGVEIDVAETPMQQKRIIATCNRRGKPVIVATQMLESMHHSSRPTRAEASDVANAILDGADACMLSGETAIGEHPVRAVEMMSRIMVSTEHGMTIDDGAYAAARQVHQITSAVTRGAIDIAESIAARCVVIGTRSGNTAWVASQSRTKVPILGVTDSPMTYRQMNLMWGIKPVLAQRLSDNDHLVELTANYLAGDEPLRSGDLIVLVKGTGVIRRAHNTVLVHTVGDS